MTSAEEDVQAELPMLQWLSLNDVLPLLRARLAINDGGVFIMKRWDCKYIDARLDMRTGSVFLTPGNVRAGDVKKACRCSDGDPYKCSGRNLAGGDPCFCACHGL